MLKDTITKQYNMRPIIDILNELRPLMGSTDPVERQQFEQLMAELKNREVSDDEKKMIGDFYQTGLKEVEDDIIHLREKIGSDYDLLPLAYIAEKYFKKTRSWLYQRLNGYSVRGKVYTLNSAEKDIFNQAVQDIAKRISSVHI